MHNTAQPVRSQARPAITTRTTRFRRAVHPRQHSSKKPGTPLSKALSGKPGRPLQKKRPSRADSLHYACKPFRVPHTSGALTTCPANATTSRRHGKNPAYCLSINSITQAGYKDKKFIFNNALYAPNAHHTTRLPTTGRISPAAAGRHIYRADGFQLLRTSFYVKLCQKNPSARHLPIPLRRLASVRQEPFRDRFFCNLSTASPLYKYCKYILFPDLCPPGHTSAGEKKGSAPRFLHHAFRRVPPT